MMATSSLPSTSSSKTIYDSSTAMPFALQQKRQQHRYTDTCLFYPPAFSSRHRHGYVRRYSTTSIDSGMTTTTTRSGHSSLHRKAMSLGTLPLLLQQQNDGLDQFISRRQEGMQHDISSNNSNNNNNMPCKYQLDPLPIFISFSLSCAPLLFYACFYFSVKLTRYLIDLYSISTVLFIDDTQEYSQWYQRHWPTECHGHTVAPDTATTSAIVATTPNSTHFRGVFTTHISSVYPRHHD